MSLEDKIDKLTLAIESNTRALLGGKSAVGSTSTTASTPTQPAARGRPRTQPAVTPAASDDGLGGGGEPEQTTLTTELVRDKLLEVKAKKGVDAARKIMGDFSVVSANAVPNELWEDVYTACEVALAK